MTKNYAVWEGGAEFVETLRQSRAELEGFMHEQGPEGRQRIAEGFAEYLTKAVGRDPNALPMGLSETLDNAREQGGNKVTGALKGIKNDFYNLFDKHPNLMLTTGGIVGLGGGLGLLKHYGLNQGSLGGKITSIGNMIFQSEKLVTLSTGPARKKMEAQDDSISARLADALNGKIPDATLPADMDAESPEGKMVAKSGKAFGKAFQGMVKHREMLIGNILVAGETFQTAGFLTNAYFDKNRIASLDPEMHKSEMATAKGGVINTASNTLLMGMTYYSQYISPKLQGLEKDSPTYKEDLAQVWKEAPKGAIFAPGRIAAKLVGALPDKARAGLPNLTIACSFLPLLGMAKEGAKGNIPLQLYGSLAVMAAVVLNYTAITTGSRPQKVMKSADAEQLANVLGEAAKPGISQNPSIAAGQVDELKDVLMGQSFMAPEYEGLVEQKLAQQLGRKFVSVRDHSKPLPMSKDPMVLASGHAVTQTVSALGAASADIQQDGVVLSFDAQDAAVSKAVQAMSHLTQQGESHAAKALGAMEWQQADGSAAQLKVSLRGLPALKEVVAALKAMPDLESRSVEELGETVKQVLPTVRQPSHDVTVQRAASPQQAR
ncbi:MAG: hypothetical protein FJX23_04340 [Alphaproteobacteria bacterium]|nr:hypothetical protein [Alphaproteobacteria bacterium]